MICGAAEATLEKTKHNYSLKQKAQKSAPLLGMNVSEAERIMSESAKLLEPGFSVADAEYPKFAFRDGFVILEFVDWRGREVRVRFSNAAGVKWQELDSRGPEDRDDSVYEIVDSSWLDEYLASDARTLADALKHFRLCFNACGVLDVLCTSMVIEDAG